MGPMLPSALVGAEFLTSACGIAGAFPVSITSRLGFEAHLSDLDGRADMAFCVTPLAGERDALASRDTATWPYPDRVWEGIASLGQLWAEPGSLLGTRLANVWLEFDLRPGMRPVPVPAVLLGMDDPEVAEPASAATWRAEADRDSTTALVGLEALLGYRLPAGLRFMVARCFAALPPGAKVFQVGAMLSRPAKGIRICVRRLPRDSLRSYLHAVGWTGDLAGVNPLLRQLSERAQFIALDLDVGARDLFPALGIECSFARQPGSEPGWRVLLEFVCDLGLCRPDKAEALLRWPSETIDAACGHVVVHAVSHVKLVHLPTGLLEAKAYFGTWIRPTARAFLQWVPA
jgi:hypothetical protein